MSKFCSLEFQVLKILQNKGINRVPSLYFILFSGGKDSTVLVNIFWKLAQYSAMEIQIIHFNHQTRGEENKIEMQHVQDFCEQRKLPLQVLFYEGKEKSQENLRNWRRDECQKILTLNTSHKPKWLVTGHHIQDLAETLLFNLIRGTGLPGLASLKEVSGHWLKPLLQIHPEDIENYRKTQKLDFKEDSSNGTLKYTRNVIRQCVLPEALKINPNFFQKAFQLNQTVQKYVCNGESQQEFLMLTLDTTQTHIYEYLRNQGYLTSRQSVVQNIFEHVQKHLKQKKNYTIPLNRKNSAYISNCRLVFMAT